MVVIFWYALEVTKMCFIDFGKLNTTLLHAMRFEHITPSMNNVL